MHVYYTVVTFGPSYCLANKAHTSADFAEKAAQRIRERSNGTTTARIVKCEGRTRAEALRKVRAADIGA